MIDYAARFISMTPLIRFAYDAQACMSPRAKWFEPLVVMVHADEGRKTGRRKLVLFVDHIEVT